MRATIDRFEGNFAVCETENREMIGIDKSKLPPQAKEGDVLIKEGDIIHIDINETESRKKEIEKLMDDLWE